MGLEPMNNPRGAKRGPAQSAGFLPKVMIAGFIGGVSVGLAGYAWWSHHAAENTYRYKIVVTVDTPEGPRIGSSVREIRYFKALIKLPDSAAADAQETGEAVVVDLPDGKPLFALAALDPYFLLQAAYGDDGSDTLNAARAERRIVPLKPIPGSIPSQSGYPTFIRFGDVKNPATAEEVDPRSIISGKNKYSVRSIKVQMTDEPLTESIDSRLPWLNSFNDRYIGHTYIMCTCLFKREA